MSVLTVMSPFKDLIDKAFGPDKRTLEFSMRVRLPSITRYTTLYGHVETPGPAKGACSTVVIFNDIRLPNRIKWASGVEVLMCRDSPESTMIFPSITRERLQFICINNTLILHRTHAMTNFNRLNNERLFESIFKVIFWCKKKKTENNLATVV